jgi:hypothetical protein
MAVADEHVHYNKALPELVEDMIISKKIIVDKLFNDDAYDGNDIFRCLSNNGILPCIKVMKNDQVILNIACNPYKPVSTSPKK